MRIEEPISFDDQQLMPVMFQFNWPSGFQR